jgi:hypothetical protein
MGLFWTDRKAYREIIILEFGVELQIILAGWTKFINVQNFIN